MALQADSTVDMNGVAKIAFAKGPHGTHTAAHLPFVTDGGLFSSRRPPYGDEEATRNNQT